VKKGVILGHVDRFETDQKVLTDAPAGTAAPAGPATALASPGASRTELIRVFYVVLYPYSRNRPEFSPTATMCAPLRDSGRLSVPWAPTRRAPALSSTTAAAARATVRCVVAAPVVAAAWRRHRPMIV
jgi:hypothetical protein